MPAGPSSWGQDLGEENDARLGRAVGAEHGKAALPGLRGHVDDPAPPTAGDHALRARAGHHPRALQIDVEHAIPLGLRDLQQRSAAHAQAGATGHVAAQLDRAEDLVHLRHRGVHLGPR